MEPAPTSVARGDRTAFGTRRVSAEEVTLSIADVRTYRLA
jgi:hypothetical protein